MGARGRVAGGGAPTRSAACNRRRSAYSGSRAPHRHLRPPYVAPPQRAAGTPEPVSANGAILRKVTENVSLALLATAEMPTETAAQKRAKVEAFACELHLLGPQPAPADPLLGSRS